MFTMQQLPSRSFGHSEGIKVFNPWFKDWIIEWEFRNCVAMISNLLAQISYPQEVIREVYIGKNQKSPNILSSQFRVWVKFIQNLFLSLVGLLWPLEWTYTAWVLRLSNLYYLSGMIAWAGLTAWVTYLSFEKSF